MPMSESQKIIVVSVVLIAIGVFFYSQNRQKYNYSYSEEHLEGFGTGNEDMTQSNMADLVNVGNSNNELSELVDDNTVDTRAYSKMLSKNSARGSYKSSSYKSGSRSSQSSDLDKFFDSNHPNDTKNTNFTASTDGTGRYAAYSSSQMLDVAQENGNATAGKNRSRKTKSEKDKFDPKGLLPSEKNGDWFDDPYETTNIASSQLINIFRPVGVDTIQSTLKNPSLDLRGGEFNPKYPVSPWNNSSIEPDTNINAKLAFC